MIKKYELTYLAPPESTEEELKALQDKLTASIQDKKGTVVEYQKAFRKKLYYPVKKKDVAYVTTVIFEIDPEGLKTLEKELKENPLVLRSLTVQFRVIKPQPLRVRRRLPREVVEEKKEEETPVVKKERTKAELNQIEEKLDEILQQ